MKRQFFCASALFGLFFTNAAIGHEFPCPDPQQLEFKYSDFSSDWEAIPGQHPADLPDIFKTLLKTPYVAEVPGGVESPYRVSGITFHSAVYSRKPVLSYKCFYSYHADDKQYFVTFDLGGFHPAKMGGRSIIIVPGKDWKWDEASDKPEGHVCTESREHCQFKLPKVGFSYSVKASDSEEKTPEYRIGFQWEDDRENYPFERVQWLFQRSAIERSESHSELNKSDGMIPGYNHADWVVEDKSVKVPSVWLVFDQPEKEGYTRVGGLHSSMLAHGSKSIKNEVCDTSGEKLSRCDCSKDNLSAVLSAPGHTQIFIENHYDINTKTPDFRCDLYYFADKHCAQHHERHDHDGGL